MKARIWHNPSCGTSRKTLDRLRAEPGLQIEIIEYLKEPPDRATLARLYARAGMTPLEGLRTRGTSIDALGLTGAGDNEILDAMMREPALIERPLVETAKGVRLCRPMERVEEIL